MDKDTYELEVRQAIRFFWKTRTKAIKNKKNRGKSDQGTRGGATAGKNLDGFAKLIARQVEFSATTPVEIHESRKLVTLPGYYRPTKQWDLAIMQGDTLLAVIELKSLGGPSFGNNANNRCEEALGSGIYFRRAQREGSFGRAANPFLGYFILVTDDVASRRPARKTPSSPHFECESAFASASYQERMAILCERMVQEGIYDSAAAMSSPPNAERSGVFGDISETTSFRKLLARLCARIAADTSLI